jgi:hypothetical protein
MIQDLHAHLFHPRWYPARFQEAMVRDFVQRQRQAGRRDPAAMSKQLLRMLTDDTGDATLRIMDKVGIEKRVILVLDWGVELGEAEKSIQEIHEELFKICHRFSDRLVGFAGVDPRRPDAVQLMEWAFDELGARGLKFHPTGGWRLSDARTLEVVSVAAERKLPVLVHLGKTVDVLNDAHAQPAPFLELAARFPGIPFIAGHSGFDLWEEFLKRAVTPNVFFDTSGWQERVRGDGSNILADLRRLHAAFPGRLCFGTDSPFYSFNMVLSEKQWLDRMSQAQDVRWVSLELLLGDWTAASRSIPAASAGLCAEQKS